MLPQEKIFFKNYGVFLFFIGVFIFLYFLNAIFPTQSDDMGAGFGGLTAAINWYNNWNGRFGELLRVSFGSYLATTPFYAPINALVGTAVILMLFVNVFARKPKSTLKDISILSVLIVFLLLDKGFCFGAVFYWAAGSFNHLLAWFFILLWTMPYRFYWHDIIVNKKEIRQSNHKVLKTIFLLFTGFLAGWATEFGIVFVFLQICLMIYSYFVRKETLPIWYFIGIISILAGWLFLYTCPGISVRVKALISYGGDYLSISEIMNMPFTLLLKTIFHTYNRVISRVYHVNYILVSLFLLIISFSYSRVLENFLITLSAIMSMGVCLFVFPKLLFLLCIIFLMILYAYKFKKDNHDIYRLFMILACVLLAELVFIGATIQVYIPRRASFQYSIVNFILISILMNYCFNEFKNNFKVKFIAFVCCLCISFPTVMFVSFECYRMKQKWDLMLESIAIQKNNGIMDVIVDKETFVSKYWSYGEWSNPDENYSEWPNTSYAEVYGVDTFTAK